MRDALDFRRNFPTPTATLDFYRGVQAAENRYALVSEFEIASPTGKAFRVNGGQIARFLVVSGPQIVDIDVFNADNPRERLWANQTLNREGFWLSTFSRLWSNMPWFRPLATITHDGVETDQSAGAARHHHIFGGHCNPYFWRVATGHVGLPNCYDNLCKAVAEFGLPAESVHDNLNLFQKTLLAPDGKMRTVRSDACPGDFVDFYAEMDVLFAASLCPRGSGATEPSDPIQERHPIRVQIFETGIAPLEFSHDAR